MFRITSLFLLLAVFALFVIGCSNADNVTAPVAPERAVEINDHSLLGYYRFAINPTTFEFEPVPVRQTAIHMNVKQYVSPPACMDCISIQPTGPYSGNILPINVTLKNPTPLTGHDVRGILIVNEPNVELRNPDAYTELYDDGGSITMNPFRAFAKEAIDRAFGPGLSYTEPFELYLSKFGKVNIIDFAVDASYPGRAVEPYDFDNFVQDTPLDELGVTPCDFSIDVMSANGNVSEAYLDAKALAIPDDITLVQGSGDQWTGQIINVFKMPPGTYDCTIRAKTSASPLWLYETVTFEVTEAVVTLSGDIQPLFDTYCISCHGSVAPPLDLDLSEGNAYSNIVGVTSVQSAMKRIEPDAPALSYLWAKVQGIHDGFPYVGSGDQMPKDGPPYMTDEEIQLLTAWINGGALDN